jgi:hypothetical protein
MTSPSGPASITPNPAIHVQPSSKSPQRGAPFSAREMEAIGTYLIDSILAKVLLALSGITVFGIHPFAGLATWANNLETAANNALTNAATAQTTASTANTNATGALAKIEDFLSGLAKTTMSDAAAFINTIETDASQAATDIANFLTGLEKTTMADAAAFVNGIETFGQNILDGLWQAFTGLFGIGKSTALLSNAASQTNAAAQNAKELALINSGTLANAAVAKPSYLGVDASADAVFPVSQISGSSPTTVALTSTTSVIGFIGTPDGGIKESVIWLGETTTNITGFYVNIYSLNTSTGTLNLSYASSNIIGQVSNGLTWNYFDLPPANYITAAQSNWYAVELAVTGTGTYQVVGIPSHWLPTNSNVYPKGLAASRTTSGGATAPSTISSPIYSSNVPWLALGGSAGISQQVPVLTEYAAAGTYTYTLPAWMISGDKIDIAALGGGGGGQKGSVLGIRGSGGVGGMWAAPVTLTYGVDIPTTVTTIAVTVGSGGAGGSSGSGHGSAGSASTVTVTGYGTINAAGGVGGSTAALGGSITGASPGNKTFNGITYYGGAASGQVGATGQAPGGAGAGGNGILFGPGGNGADGAVWITAHQP